MLVRREHPGDEAAIRGVHQAAFGGIAECRLVDDLRRSDAWIPRLSLVAVDAGRVVGHVVCSRALLGGVPALGLAPLGVLPGQQQRGVGSALVHAVLGAAEALDEPLVALLGDPAFYARFGFRPAAELRVEAPVGEWQPHFQVRPLATAPGDIAGRFRYAEAFDRLES